MSEFNYTTPIASLQASSKKKEDKKEEELDKEYVNIVNAIIGITGRQDLIFLHELAPSPRNSAIAWEPIIIELFLNRPIILEKGESKEERAIKALYES